MDAGDVDNLVTSFLRDCPKAIRLWEMAHLQENVGEAGNRSLSWTHSPTTAEGCS